MAGEEFRADLWAFMSTIYARPGVAPACLRLQEAHGLDVPLLLGALYAVTRGRLIDRSALAVLDTRCAPWRDSVIRSLRRIRQDMKMPGLADLHPDAAVLRESIKAQELEAERIEADLLADLIERLPEGTDCKQPDAEAKFGVAIEITLDLWDPSRAARIPADTAPLVSACQNWQLQRRPSE